MSVQKGPGRGLWCVCPEAELQRSGWTGLPNSTKVLAQWLDQCSQQERPSFSLPHHLPALSFGSNFCQSDGCDRGLIDGLLHYITLDSGVPSLWTASLYPCSCRNRFPFFPPWPPGPFCAACLPFSTPVASEAELNGCIKSLPCHLASIGCRKSEGGRGGK